MPEKPRTVRVTVRDIAAACEISERTVRDWTQYPSWPAGVPTGKGGALTWELSALPGELVLKGRGIPVRALVAVAVLEPTPAAAPPPAAPSTALVPAKATPPAVAMKGTAVVPAAGEGAPNLTTRQRDIDRARARLVRFIAEFKGPDTQAIAFLNAGYANLTLSDHLRWAFEHAWDKPREAHSLTRSTLCKWHAIKKERGRYAPAVRQPDMEIKPWYPLLMALRKRPQGGTLAWIEEQLREQWNPEWGAQPPGYHTIRRACTQKLSQLDQLKGRYTGSQLRSRTHYQPRTAVGMQPWDEVHADGWGSHFEAPHPVTWEYVSYEVWHAHDVATRYVPPLSVGLSENFEVIAKCIENAVAEGGVMRILQTDSTKIVRDSPRFKTNPAIAIADRVGFTIVHPKEVGNSQANGIAENFNTFLDREARELATYRGKNMDTLTYKRVKRITNAMVKAQVRGDLAEYNRLSHEAEKMGKGLVLRSFAETLEWLESKRQKWNNHPHSALPIIRDPLTGRKRHMSPNEAIAAAKAAGWTPVAMDEAERVASFRPHVQKKVIRGAVTPYGKMRYRHPDLDAYLGQDVVVAYDMTDYRQVIVKTLKGDEICVADFVEATGYRSQTAQEEAEEKRLLATLKRRERKDSVLRARVPSATLEHQEPERLQTIVDFLPTSERAKPEPEKSYLDFLPTEPKAAPEPEKTIADFLPDKPAKAQQEMSYSEVAAWLYGPSEGDETKEDGGEGDDTPKEAAAE